MHFTLFDIAILTILLIFTLRGALKGLIGEVMGFVAVLLSLVLTVRWLSLGTALLRSVVDLAPALAMILSFVLIFALVFWGTLVLARVLRKVLRVTMLGWVDRLGGAAFGLLTGALLVSLLVMVVSLIPLNQKYRTQEQESLLFYPTRRFAPELFNWVVSVFPSTGDFYQEVHQAVTSKTRSLGGPLKEFLQSVQKRAIADSTQDRKSVP